MDGENNGKPYFLMDDLGGNPLFLETPIYMLYVFSYPQHTNMYTQVNHALAFDPYLQTLLECVAELFFEVETSSSNNLYTFFMG